MTVGRCAAGALSGGASLHRSGSETSNGLRTKTRCLPVEALDKIHRSLYEFPVLGADVLGNVYEQFLRSVIRLTRALMLPEDSPSVLPASFSQACRARSSTARHLDVDVDAVHEGTRDSLLVVRLTHAFSHHATGAGALPRRIAMVPTGTRCVAFLPCQVDRSKAIPSRISQRDEDPGGSPEEEAAGPWASPKRGG